MGSAKIGIRGTRFVDPQGRHVILRGVNFGGDCKVPYSPNGHTYLPTDFADHREVSFVGRPAPLDELDGHLARLRHWGFNCLRLLTTWEAVEHAGPGLHDEAYLDYLARVCRRAGDYGLRVFIDFHQDVWSRMSGGDGAPGWTFEAAGLDFTKFDAADAAHVMQWRYDHRLGGRQESYPQMSWSPNSSRPANAIMWTLFFAGERFAPGATVDGVNIQQHLQGHYLGAMRAVADRVADLDHVIGFDTLNEPGTGYIGRPLSEPLRRLWGQAWSPLDGLAVAAGQSRRIPLLAFGGAVTTEHILANANGVPIWLPGREDPFRAAGAWDLDADGAVAPLREDFFEQGPNGTVEVERDFMVPFFNRVAATVRAVRDDWLVFAEVNPFAALRGVGFPDGCPERTVNASHWYDVTALVTKRFDGVSSTSVISGETHEGAAAIEAGYVGELRRLRELGEALNGGAPSLVGEFGIPYDMNDAQAYRRWADGERGSDIWEAQTAALTLMYNALDALLMSSTQWNYTVSNRNDAMIGDGWNQEDLSIWSIDQTTDDADPNSGGRAVQGFCRPFVRAAQGTLLRQAFDRDTGAFTATVLAEPEIDAATELYVPAIHYPNGFEVSADGAAVVVEPQLALVRTEREGELTIRITRR